MALIIFEILCFPVRPSVIASCFVDDETEADVDGAGGQGARHCNDRRQTLDESGVRGYVVTGFHLLLAPGATPADIVMKLNAETVKALESPAIREKLASFGLEPAGSSPAECAKFVPVQIALWTPVMKAGGIRAD